MQIKYISRTSSHPSGLLQKAGAIIATTALAVVALMFSAVLLAIILIVGAVAFSYLWWKMRALRRRLRERMQDIPRGYAARERDVPGGIIEGEIIEGEVIEGEAIRVDAKRDTP